MRHRYFLPVTLLMLTLILTAGPALSGWGDTLKAGAKAVGLSYSTAEAESAVKEVLTLGKDYAIETLGKDGGFSDNVYAAISLPDSLSKLASMSGLTSTLNSAAEDAVPELSTAFDTTIDGMDLSDPRPLLKSVKSSTGITDYFEDQSFATLKELAMPIVKKHLYGAGLSSYTGLISAVGTASGFDPVSYTTDKILDAMFHYMGEKETSLRESGGEGASALLKKIF